MAVWSKGDNSSAFAKKIRAMAKKTKFKEPKDLQQFVDNLRLSDEGWDEINRILDEEKKQ